VGEETTALRFGFNGSIRVATRGDRLTSNAGALLLRDLDDRLGVTQWLSEKLHDPRDAERVRHEMPELLRTRILLMALGHRDQGDADLHRRDPALRLAVSEAAGITPLSEDCGLASQPTLSRLIDTLSVPTNLHWLNAALIESALRAGRATAKLARGTQAIIDVDSLPIEVHGHQAGSEWNGHYGIRCYHPLVAMLGETGHWIGVELRAGNVHTADGVQDFLAPLLNRIALATGAKPRVRADAGFPCEGLLSWLEARGNDYVFRVRNNSVLDEMATPFLVRPPGRRPKEPREWVHELNYKAGSWKAARRVVLVVQERADELFLHHFFLVTNGTAKDWPADRLLADYRQRGTMETRLGELQSVLAPALSCTQRGAERSEDSSAVEFRNAATLVLFALAYNLAHTARSVLARSSREPFSLDRLRRRLLAVAGLITISARRATLAINTRVAALWAAFARALQKLVPRPARA
jgi:hypothetical protein